MAEGEELGSNALRREKPLMRCWPLTAVYLDGLGTVIAAVHQQAYGEHHDTFNVPAVTIDKDWAAVGEELRFRGLGRPQQVVPVVSG